MTEALPPCPDSSCTFMASEENPTGQYVTAEHAATNPATTVREDDSRVRELQRRLDTQPGDATIRAWLDRAREYPTASGVLGWVADRDGLIALLSECYVRGVPASVIPHAVDEDVVTFRVQFSVSFARSELTDPTVNAEEQP